MPARGQRQQPKAAAPPGTPGGSGTPGTPGGSPKDPKNASPKSDSYDPQPRTSALSILLFSPAPLGVCVFSVIAAFLTGSLSFEVRKPYSRHVIFAAGPKFDEEGVDHLLNNGAAEEAGKWNKERQELVREKAELVRSVEQYVAEQGRLREKLASAEQLREKLADAENTAKSVREELGVAKKELGGAAKKVEEAKREAAKLSREEREKGRSRGWSGLWEKSGVGSSA